MTDNLYSPLLYFGIPYKWGGSSPTDGLDCFGLMNWLQSTHRGGVVRGLEWVYEKYPNEKSLPDGFMMRQIIELLGQPTLSSLKDLDVGVFKFNHRMGLGTYLVYQGRGYWVYQTDYGSRVTESYRLSNFMVAKYDVSPLLSPLHIFS